MLELKYNLFLLKESLHGTFFGAAHLERSILIERLHRGPMSGDEGVELTASACRVRGNFMELTVSADARVEKLTLLGWRTLLDGACLEKSGTLVFLVPSVDVLRVSVGDSRWLVRCLGAPVALLSRLGNQGKQLWHSKVHRFVAFSLLVHMAILALVHVNPLSKTIPGAATVRIGNKNMSVVQVKLESAGALGASAALRSPMIYYVKGGPKDSKPAGDILSELTKSLTQGALAIPVARGTMQTQGREVPAGESALNLKNLLSQRSYAPPRIELQTSSAAHVVQKTASVNEAKVREVFRNLQGPMRSAYERALKSDRSLALTLSYVVSVRSDGTLGALQFTPAGIYTEKGLATLTAELTHVLASVHLDPALSGVQIKGENLYMQ